MTMHTPLMMVVTSVTHGLSSNCPRASSHAPVITTGPQLLAAANKDNEEAERVESLGKPDGSPDDEGLDVPESSPPAPIISGVPKMIWI